MSGSPRRAQPFNTSFPNLQQIWIILEFGSLKNTSKLRPTFRVHFGPTLRQVPSYNAFLKLFQRSQGQVRPQVPSENHPPKQKAVKKFKDSFECHQKNKKALSIRFIAQPLNLSAASVWQEFADSMYCGEVLRPVRHVRGSPKKCTQLQGAVVEPFV